MSMRTVNVDTYGLRCDWEWCSLQAGRRLATYCFLPLNRHGVLQNSCYAVLLLVPCIRSAKQLLSRTAAFSAAEAFSPPWSQPSSQLRGRSGRQSNFAQGLSPFSLLQTPARENELSAFDPHRYPVRRNVAFHLMIVFADKKGEMCCVSAVEEPDASRPTWIRVRRGHTWGATQPTANKDSWCVESLWAWFSSLSQPYTLWKWTFRFSLITSPECSIMSECCQTADLKVFSAFQQTWADFWPFCLELWLNSC